MTWQYLLSEDDSGLRTATVYKNGSEVGTFQNGDHPDISDSQADFYGFSVDKIKDLMHSQALDQHQQAAQEFSNGNLDAMHGHINEWMSIVEDSSFEQIVEVDSPP
jgi:hypothetical protein